MTSCGLVQLRMSSDERGDLVAIEGSQDLPFDIKRVYFICGVEPGTERGFHAHRDLRQLMVCASGSCTVVLDDGDDRVTYRLDRPSTGLLVDRMVWREMYEFSDNTVLLVLASDHYEPDDYIFSHEEFTRLLQHREDGDGKTQSSES